MLLLAQEILRILLPAASLASIGLIWARRGPAFPVDFVTTLVINVTLPALLFHTLATAQVDLFSLGSMVVATVLLHALVVPLAILLLRGTGKDWRLSVALSVGNTGNLGLPVCFFAFGEAGLAYAVTFFSVQCLLLFSLGDAIYAGQISWRRLFGSPILPAILAGVAVRALELELYSVVSSTAQLLGQVTIPLMLITLGVSLAGMRAGQVGSSIRWSLVRVALGLGMGLLVAEVLGLAGVARGVLIIESCVPVAVFNYLLSVRHGRDPTEVSGLILVTHLAAILYLPLVLGFVLV